MLFVGHFFGLQHQILDAQRMAGKVYKQKINGPRT
jgi:hypothetical protein